MRRKTFKIRKWRKPDEHYPEEPVFEFEFGCEHCGNVAFIPHVGPKPFIIYIRDMGFVHEPGAAPKAGQFPQEVECRKCHHLYEL